MDAWLSLAGVALGALIAGFFSWLTRSRDADFRLNTERREAYVAFLAALRHWEELGTDMDAAHAQALEAQEKGKNLEEQGDKEGALAAYTEATERSGPEIERLKEDMPVRREALSHALDEVSLVAPMTVLDAATQLFEALEDPDQRAKSRAAFLAAARKDIGSKI